MESPFPPMWRSFFVLVTLFFFSMPVSADFTVSYCSSQNTGSTDVFNWDWQSNGKCTDHCNGLGSYAYAVIQYKSCWCSNYIPQQRTNPNSCLKDCPGYPDEKCGDVDAGLYIYIAISGKASGTAGGSQPASTIVTSTTKTTSTQQNAPTSSQAQQPQTSVQVVTESGAIVTRTVVQTPSSAPSGNGSQGKQSNVGAIAGGVVGGVVGLAAIISLLIFFLLRRRGQERDRGVDSPTGITRNTSTMSKAGLLGGVSAREPQYPPQIVTSFGSQSSRHDTESISPVSRPERRLSQPLMIDSRLNPNAVLTFAGSNASRDSFVSLDDSRDYGRTLNVRNPDPS